MGEKLRELEERRKHVGERLTGIGDMRQGSVYERYSKCGKAGCRCAVEEKYLHGPKVTLTKTAGGKTVLRTIPKAAVESTKAQIERFQQFRRVSQEFLAVNEEICEAKLTDSGEQTDVAQKKTLRRSSKPS